MRQGLNSKNKKKNNVKISPKFFILLAAIIIVIVVIVLIVKGGKNDDSKITLDGSGNANVDGQQVNNNQEIEYDGNPYNVPQSYTTTVNDFIGESGEELDENTLPSIKEEIKSKFTSMSTEQIGINVDMQNIRIIFNQGTTTIADNNCLVFSVYEQKDGSLNFVSKYAMSTNTEILYKYDSSANMFNMIQ